MNRTASPVADATRICTVGEPTTSTGLSNVADEKSACCPGISSATPLTRLDRLPVKVPGSVLIAPGVPLGGLDAGWAGPRTSILTGAGLPGAPGCRSLEKPDVVIRRVSASKPESLEKVKPVPGTPP